MTRGRRPKALLVCSNGGHLREMLQLEPSWRHHDVTWATLPGADVDRLLDGRQVELCHGPTNRSLRCLVKNLFVARRLLRDLRPDVILSTGAAVAVPFFVLGRLMGVRTVYIESLTRIDSLSLTGRLVYRLSSAFFVQWPQAAKGRPKAVYAGNLLGQGAAEAEPEAAPEHAPEHTHPRTTGEARIALGT